VSNSITLGNLIYNAQSLSDQLNSDFVSTEEWTNWANVGYGKLYDLLISSYGTNYYASYPVQVLTAPGQMFYPLPDGETEFFTPGLSPTQGPGMIVAPAFYKLLGVDINFNGGFSNGTNNQFNFLTLVPFMFGERNRNNVFQGGGLAGGGVSVLANAYSYDYRYRLHSIDSVDYLWLTPQAPAGFCLQVWYAPELTPLVELTDVVTMVAGWEELIELDMAIKAMVKEESDPTALIAARAETIQRIKDLAAVRDAGAPDYIRDVYATGMATAGGWGNGYGGGFMGGW
jgi:hypothetical protein